jgi:hypothetical protein
MIETYEDGVVVIARNTVEAQQAAGDAMGGECTIISVERVREGGIGGFFATELVRVVAKPSSFHRSDRELSAAMTSAEELVSSLRTGSPQFADRLMDELRHTQAPVAAASTAISTSLLERLETLEGAHPAASASDVLDTIAHRCRPTDRSDDAAGTSGVIDVGMFEDQVDDDDMDQLDHFHPLHPLEHLDRLEQIRAASSYHDDHDDFADPDDDLPNDVVVPTVRRDLNTPMSAQRAAAPTSPTTRAAASASDTIGLRALTNLYTAGDPYPARPSATAPAAIAASFAPVRSTRPDADHRWSHQTLRALGVPDRIVDAALLDRPRDSREWIIALMSALRTMCQPLPTMPVMMVGPTCANLARQLKLINVSADELADSLSSVAVAHVSAPTARDSLNSRAVHLVVGGSWQHLASLHCQVVSAASGSDILDAMRVCAAWDANLGWCWNGERYERLDEFSVVAHIRSILLSMDDTVGDDDDEACSTAVRSA